MHSPGGKRAPLVCLTVGVPHKLAIEKVPGTKVLPGLFDQPELICQDFEALAASQASQPAGHVWQPELVMLLPAL